MYHTIRLFVTAAETGELRGQGNMSKEIQLPLTHAHNAQQHQPSQPATYMQHMAAHCSHLHTFVVAGAAMKLTTVRSAHAPCYFGCC